MYVKFLLSVSSSLLSINLNLGYHYSMICWDRFCLCHNLHLNKTTAERRIKWRIIPSFFETGHCLFMVVQAPLLVESIYNRVSILLGAGTSKIFVFYDSFPLLLLDTRILKLNEKGVWKNYFRYFISTKSRSFLKQ